MSTGFVRLEVRRVVRARKFWIVAFVFPTLMYVMQANLFSGEIVTRTTIDFDKYLVGNLAAFGAFFVALNIGTRVAIERSSGWQRQLRLTPLSATSYLVGKLSAAMVVALPAIAAVAAAGALFEGVRMPIGGWAHLVLGVWIGTLPFALLGVFIGQIATAESVQVYATSTHMLLGVLGGALFPSVAFPQWMQAVSTIMPSRWLAEIGHSAFAGGTGDTAKAAAILAAWTVLLGGAVTWRYLRDAARV